MKDNIIPLAFKKIYFFDYSSFKFLQEKFFSIEDQTTDSYLYTSKLFINTQIAKSIIEIIKSLSDPNIHILGIGNGCWISKLLLFEGDQDFVNKIKGMYLAIPEIPDGLTLPLPTDKNLTNIRFRLYFRNDDAYQFYWDEKSNTEYDYYKNQLDKLLENKIIVKNKLDDLIHNIESFEPEDENIHTTNNHEINFQILNHLTFDFLNK